MVRVAVTCAFAVMARSGHRPGTGGLPRGTGRNPVAILRSASCGSEVEDTEGVEPRTRGNLLAGRSRGGAAPCHGAFADSTAMPPDLPGAEHGTVVLRRSDVAAALYDLPVRQREVIALQY